MGTALKLVRAYTDWGTWGKLYLDGEFFCYSVERPWLNNKPNVSCIPAGRYELVRHRSAKFGDCYALRNKQLGVGIYEGLRTHILIHAANTPSHVQGCIGLGYEPGTLKDEWAILQSRPAIEAFERACLSRNLTHLEIV
ncbi:hypothetical protein KUW19_00775 [Ferrimonas balearica]|uniref:DUF5675 family protein n=1 Tax=Ferrimonas balearica TaxID=44012 RepID=UPI001C983D78|nr:DUF5675 family protein [Ferrimonas balearica]MBY6105010.1 hypothetical protein [Ferrimonas balearica]